MATSIGPAAATRTVRRRWHPLPQPAKVVQRVTTITASRQVTGLLHAETGTDPATGRPTLAWWFDPVALDAEAASDG